MTVSTANRLPHAPEKVFATMMNAEFQQFVVDKLNGKLQSFSVVPRRFGTSDPVRTKVTRVLDSTELEGKVPEFARRFISGGIVVKQAEEWTAADPQGQRDCQLLMEIPTVKLTGEGVQKLVAVGDGNETDIIIEADLKSGFPLFGSKIVNFVRPVLASVAQSQADAIDLWLKKQAQEARKKQGK